ARHGVEVVNSHATRDRRALTWLRWRGRLPQAFVVTRRTMPLTSSLELLAVGLTADRTIAVSTGVARALRRRLHPGAGLRVVPNGIALERVDAAVAGSELAAARATLGDVADRSVLAVVSRLKDQHVVLQALPLIERPMVVAFVGGGPHARGCGPAGATRARGRGRSSAASGRAPARAASRARDGSWCEATSPSSGRRSGPRPFIARRWSDGEGAARRTTATAAETTSSAAVRWSCGNRSRSASAGTDRCGACSCGCPPSRRLRTPPVAPALGLPDCSCRKGSTGR